MRRVWHILWWSQSLSTLVVQVVLGLGLCVLWKGKRSHLFGLSQAADFQPRFGNKRKALKCGLSLSLYLSHTYTPRTFPLSPINYYFPSFPPLHPLVNNAKESPKLHKMLITNTSHSKKAQNWISSLCWHKVRAVNVIGLVLCKLPGT